MFVQRLPSTIVAALTAMLGVAALLLAAPNSAAAQSEPAGIGPGRYIQVGGQVSGYHINYGMQSLGGAGIFADANFYRKFGVEAEARMFRFHESEEVHDSTYLVGPRFSILSGRFRPYAKLLVGRGEFYYPFHYAKGSYNVVAPGGGIDWHPEGTRLTIRVLDVETQNWPNFSYGSLHAYGISSGIALRVF